MPTDKENQFIIESLERRQMMDGAPGDIVLPGGIEQPEAVIEAPAVIGEIEQPVNVTPNDADFLTRASIKQLLPTQNLSVTPRRGCMWRKIPAKQSSP